MSLWEEVFGWSGTIAILSAYGLGALGILAATTALYQLLNVYAACAIAFLAYRRGVTERAVLNAAWGVIALMALVKVFL